MFVSDGALMFLAVAVADKKLKIVPSFCRKAGSGDANREAVEPTRGEVDDVGFS